MYGLPVDEKYVSRRYGSCGIVGGKTVIIFDLAAGAVRGALDSATRCDNEK